MEAGFKFGHVRVSDKKWRRWKTEQKPLQGFGLIEFTARWVVGRERRIGSCSCPYMILAYSPSNPLLHSPHRIASWESGFVYS